MQKTRTSTSKHIVMQKKEEEENKQIYNSDGMLGENTSFLPLRLPYYLSFNVPSRFILHNKYVIVVSDLLFSVTIVDHNTY